MISSRSLAILKHLFAGDFNSMWRTSLTHNLRLTLALMICCFAAGTGSRVPAATLPAWFSETSIGGIASPTAMDIAPDGRIFVCQQGGSLRVIKNGALLSTPFMTLTVDSSGERGL